MQKVLLNEPTEICISAADLETANLNEWESLELHRLDQTVVVIPGKMTVMEVIRTADALQGLASDLLTAISKTCEKCDGCNVELLCDLMEGKICPDVSLPAAVVQEADLDPDYKLDCEIDPESGRVQIVEADYRFDLTDLPKGLLDTFRECGVCLTDLEEKLMKEVVVYGADL